MRRLSLVCALCLALLCGGLLVGTASAPAVGQSPVISDCVSHSRLTRTYTPSALRTALSTMSADVKEYTNCYDVIQRALLAQLGGKPVGGSTGSGSGGSFLPTPVIVVLVLLVLAAVTFGALAIRRRARGAPPDDGDGPPGAGAP